MIYNLRFRLKHILPKPHNERPHSHVEVRERILDLRVHGHTIRQGRIPLKGRCFTERSVHGLLRKSDAAKILTPKHYLQMMLTKMERAQALTRPL